MLFKYVNRLNSYLFTNHNVFWSRSELKKTFFCRGQSLQIIFWSRSEFKIYILQSRLEFKKHILVEVRVKKMCFGRGQSLKNIFWARSEFKIIYFCRGES